MRPTTSAASTSNTTANLYFEPNSLCAEDCRFLLRALEKQAFEQVICAFRAQGPLTQYKELLLEHLKSALFISDEDFTLQARIAANNPYLSKIAQELNPSYDNFCEWIAAGFDLSGVELARARRLSLAVMPMQSAQTSQIMKQIHRHNRDLDGDDVQEDLAGLWRLQKRPFVPERLRRLLQDTETDAGGRIDIMPAEPAVAEPQKQPAKEAPEPAPKKVGRPNAIGRPRKNNNIAKPAQNEPKNGKTVGLEAENNKPKEWAKAPPTTKQQGEPPKRRLLDPSAAKTAEEQAVLAILAASSAQMSREAELQQKQQQQQKLIQQQQQQQIVQMNSVAMEQLAGTSSTGKTAMESLADVALAQDFIPISTTSSSSVQIPLPLGQRLTLTPPTMNLTSKASTTQQQQSALLPLHGPIGTTTAKMPTFAPPMGHQVQGVQQSKQPEIGAPNGPAVNEKNSSLAKMGEQQQLAKPPKKHRTVAKTSSGETSARVRPFVFNRAAQGKHRVPEMKFTLPTKRPYMDTDGALRMHPGPPQQSQQQFPPHYIQIPYSRPVKEVLEDVQFKPGENIVVDNVQQQESFRAITKILAQNPLPPPVPITTHAGAVAATQPQIQANDHSYENSINAVAGGHGQLSSFALPAPIFTVVAQPGTSTAATFASPSPPVILVNTVVSTTAAAVVEQHMNHFGEQQQFLQQNGGPSGNSMLGSGLSNGGINLNPAPSTSTLAKLDSATHALTTLLPAEGKNTVVEASGLDFLASTASLLAPIEVDNNNQPEL